MKYKTDILIIGSGASGLRAAIEAYDKGADVLVLGKCRIGDAHTVMATGGINSALGTMDPEDNWKIHAIDTLKEGRFIADPYEVELLCKNGPDAIKDLVDYGVDFHKEKDGRLTQRFFGAHTYRRTCFVGDETGKAVEKALVKQVEKRKISFLGEIYVTNLLMNGKIANGAFGFDINTGETILFNAKAVILATGGHSKLYKRSSSRVFENTGDGISLDYNVGATLEDMEMVQFHPTGMVWPLEAEGTLVTEAVRGEGGILLNSKGERFMNKYHEKGELGPRDVVARAIYNEISAGRGTKHKGVWLDITHLSKDYILERLPKVYSQFKEYLNIDVSKEKMEVAPTAHYSMGGISVDRRTNQATKIKGLFAIGEVTSGVHGANRLGGNSLLETMVFGKLGGLHTVRFVKKYGFNALNNNQIKKYEDELKKLLKNKGKYDPKELRNELQTIMWDNVGIARQENKLKLALKQLNIIKNKFKKINVNENFVIALDLKGLFIPAEAVIRSALLRKESRGAHYRSDYRKETSKGLYNIICVKGSKEMKLTKKSIPKPTHEIGKILVKEMKNEVEHKLLE